ncbi:hypothetical protein WUBG_10771 [Wuchereria bancrofti]|uniref:Uncharacterized protein n=1 Tax=Wuchereria bancrofti TaxID=6293 RepID=J9E7M9_WUCBA|nr:hypothetical protein WUBG_10771 [Wuchereria bancrofti]
MKFTNTWFKIYCLGIEIEERVWDDVLAVFQSGCWMQMIEQWSRVVGSVTRALILNLFEIDVAPPTQSGTLLPLSGSSMKVPTKSANVPRSATLPNNSLISPVAL